MGYIARMRRRDSNDLKKGITLAALLASIALPVLVIGCGAVEQASDAVDELGQDFCDTLGSEEEREECRRGLESITGQAVGVVEPVVTPPPVSADITWAVWEDECTSVEYPSHWIAEYRSRYLYISSRQLRDGDFPPELITVAPSAEAWSESAPLYDSPTDVRDTWRRDTCSGAPIDFIEDSEEYTRNGVRIAETKFVCGREGAASLGLPALMRHLVVFWLPGGYCGWCQLLDRPDSDCGSHIVFHAWAEEDDWPAFEPIQQHMVDSINFK